MIFPLVGWSEVVELTVYVLQSRWLASSQRVTLDELLSRDCLYHIFTNFHLKYHIILLYKILCRLGRGLPVAGGSPWPSPPWRATNAPGTKRRHKSHMKRHHIKEMIWQIVYSDSVQWARLASYSWRWCASKFFQELCPPLWKVDQSREVGWFGEQWHCAIPAAEILQQD